MPDLTTDTDVIVIGAGFAGLTAARELMNLGHDVLVLEGRLRVGGRTWVDSFGKFTVEYGGTWIHWSQPHVWTEITRHGIGLVEDPAPDRCFFSSGSRVHVTSTDEMWAANDAALSALFDGVADALPQPYDPTASFAAFQELDRFSIVERFGHAGLNQDQVDLVSGLLSSFSGIRKEEAAFSTLARWWALAGATFPSFWQAMLGWRIQGGTKALIDALHAPTAGRTRLGFSVADVRVEDRVTVVSTDGQRVTGRQVIVTAPVNTWPSVRFSPPLTGAHEGAARVGWSSRHGSKTLIHVRGLDERIYAQLAESWLIPLMFTYQHLGNGEQILVGLSGNPSYDSQDPHQVTEAVSSVIPGVEVVSSASHSWITDPYSQGAWPFHQPGEVSGRLADLQKSDGRLFFAGSELSTGWSGFIDGAIDSGLRAARAAHAAAPQA